MPDAVVVETPSPTAGEVLAAGPVPVGPSSEALAEAAELWVARYAATLRAGLDAGRLAEVLAAAEALRSCAGTFGATLTSLVFREVCGASPPRPSRRGR